MKKTIVNKRVLRRLKRIRDDHEIHGKSRLCPAWKGPSSWTNNCLVCKELFPKIKIPLRGYTGVWTPGGCPCYLYTPTYLIRRLNKIIQDSEEAHHETE